MSSSHEHETPAGKVIRRPHRTTPVVPYDAAFRVSSTPAERGAESAFTTAATMAEEARRAAYEEGRRRGLAEAEAAADNRHTEALEALYKELSRAARRVSVLREEIVEEVTGEAASLAVDIAEAILGRELSLGHAPALDAVRRALSLVPAGDHFVIRVHPDCGLTDADIAVLASGHRVRVERDASIDPSGCSVTAGSCHVDAGIPQALARVRAALEDLVGHDRDDDEAAVTALRTPSGSRGGSAA